MLPFLSLFTLAQVTTAPPAQEPVPLEVPASETEVIPLPPRQIEVLQPQEVRPLPGQLDDVPVFNSNSPEVVRTEGILLSTFPPTGKRWPSAHLNYPFQGRFDVFAHHIARAATPDELRTLYQGILVYNPTRQPITLRLLQSATYLAKPHAPYVNLPDYMDDPFGNVYAGPGSRIVNDVLRGRRQGMFPSSITIPPRQSRMLLNLPIPVGNRAPSSNTRSTLIRLSSNGPVYVASMAMFAPVDIVQREVDGEIVQSSFERMPEVREWENLLVSKGLAGPRDRAPTSPNSPDNRFFPNWYLYGRVAGVAKGSQWIGTATDNPKSDRLTIPQPGKAFSYAISTLPRGTLGTNQVQSAEMLVRYPDTAYQAHGNYGIQYNLEMPLYNPTDRPKQVAIALQTPLKEDQPRENGLRFLDPPEDKVFFRGTIRLRYRDERGIDQKRYVHVVQRRGQQGEPLLVLNLGPRDRKTVEVDFLYPPDSTPPQILTVQTLEIPDFRNARDRSLQGVTGVTIQNPQTAVENKVEADDGASTN